MIRNKILKLITILIAAFIITAYQHMTIYAAEPDNITNTVSKQSVALLETSTPITVIEGRYGIYIFAYVCITGDAADLLLDTKEMVTYRQAAIEGIKESWSGSYDSKTVDIIIFDLSDSELRFSQKYLEIEINSGFGQCSLRHSSKNWSKYNPGKIVMFQEDRGTRIKFSYISYWQMTFGNAVAHEFSHAMGLNHPKHEKNSIMSRPSLHATDFDYDCVLKAQKADIW